MRTIMYKYRGMEDNERMNMWLVVYTAIIAVAVGIWGN